MSSTLLHRELERKHGTRALEDIYSSELVKVEVKLEFSPPVVQQALNYTRFSHRAWVAVPVETDSNVELRENNPALFG